MKTKREVRREFLSNKEKVARVREILSSPVFNEYLDVVSTYMAPYTVESPPVDAEHKEWQRVGGVFGASKFVHLLTNVVDYTSDLQRPDDQEEFRKPTIK